MQTLKTPNIYRQEKDLSEVTVGAGTSVGAMVFSARQGVVNQRVLINTDKQLIDTFGLPIPGGVDVGIYAGMEFLKESDSLYVVRATSGSEKYACVSATTAVVSAANGVGVTASASTGTETNSPTLIADIDNALGAASILIACKGPGIYGKYIGVTLETSASTTSGGWSQKYDPAISATIFKLSVFTKDPTASALTSGGSAEEVFYGSLTYQKDGEGKQLFIDDVVNGKSNYIYIASTSGGGVPGIIGNGAGTEIVPIMLAGGVDSNATTFGVSPGSIQNAWNLFKEKTAVTVNILIDTYNTTGGATNQAVAAVAEYRLDCIACLQAGDVDDVTVANVQASFPTTVLPSYSAIYAGWDKIYDSFNDRYVYIPKCVYGAAIMARTDRVANTWDAPAGTNRGVLPSIGQNVVFSDTDIGELYDVNINTSRLIRGTGNVLWGQKTAQKKKSALDRINVRRLLLYVENSVESSLLPFLFEPNNSKTRLRAWSMVDGFMKGVLASGGVTKFECVCDDTNNTAQTIDNNELILDLYVQPTKTIEYIRLNVIVTRTGISFQEIR